MTELEKIVATSRYSLNELSGLLSLDKATLEYKLHNIRALNSSEIRKLIFVLNIRSPAKIFCSHVDKK